MLVEKKIKKKKINEAIKQQAPGIFICLFCCWESLNLISDLSVIYVNVFARTYEYTAHWICTTVPQVPSVSNKGNQVSLTLPKC